MRAATDHLFGADPPGQLLKILALILALMATASCQSSNSLSDGDYARLTACPTDDEAARQKALETRRPNGDTLNFLTCDQIAQFKSQLNPQ